MDHQVARGSQRPSTIPWAVWLLLAGALVQLGVRIAPDSYQVFGPYFLVNGGMVVEWIRAISPFVLAVVVVLAADRWPGGRRELLTATAALAVAGLLLMAMDVWWTIWEANPGLIPDGTQPWLSGAFLGAGLAMVAAYALLTAGLWAPRAPRPLGRTRVALIVLIAVAGLVATGTGLWVASLVLGYAGSDDYFWVSMATATLAAAGFAALAAVAIAAVRNARRPDWIPETLIAIGATITMAVTAWTWTLPHIAPTETWSDTTLVWAFTIPNAAAAFGTLAMIAGFGVAAVAARRRPAGDDPSA